MIWTLLVLCIFIVSLAIGIFVDDYDYKHGNIKFTGIVTAFFSGMTLLLMICFIISEHIFVDSYVEQLQAERAALVYQMDHQLYLGDALGEFNKNIIYLRHMHENPWTSWFQGDYIYEVDPIELK